MQASKNNNINSSQYMQLDTLTHNSDSIMALKELNEKVIKTHPMFKKNPENLITAEKFIASLCNYLSKIDSGDGLNKNMNN